MLSKSNILSIIVINNLLTIMFGNSYKEITGVWIGSESLSSQSSNYENKDIELRISHGGDRDGFLIYESSSSLIYNQELSWAFHYLQFNKKENALIFHRRFLTPLGILGSQQIRYSIGEVSSNLISLESDVPDNLLSHKMTLSRFMLNIGDLQPINFPLAQNYPNPFNPSTTIVVHMENYSNGELDIINLNGENIKTLFSGVMNVGISKFNWDGSDDAGKPVASGTYFYRLKMKNTFYIKKMVLLR